VPETPRCRRRGDPVGGAHRSRLFRWRRRRTGPAGCETGPRVGPTPDRRKPHQRAFPPAGGGRQHRASQPISTAETATVRHGGSRPQRDGDPVPLQPAPR
jgi:hypothetical protein